MEPITAAILDYLEGQENIPLELNTSYGGKEPMPIEVFFREEQDLNELENLALNECNGAILDIGAGAGALSQILSHRGKNVTSLETDPFLVELLRSSGLKNVVHEDIFKYDKLSFDTLLLLMNGIGIAGKLNRLDLLLNRLSTIIKPKGSVIVDSSDISYLYEDGDKPKGHYFGEISYQYEYKGIQGEWFDWLYVDSRTFREIAENCGWNFEMLYIDNHDQYLVRLTIK